MGKSKEYSLLPCPFCKGKAILKKGWCELDNYVLCERCKARTQKYNTKEGAVKSWNKRADSDLSILIPSINEPLDKLYNDFKKQYDEMSLLGLVDGVNWCGRLLDLIEGIKEGGNI